MQLLGNMVVDHGDIGDSHEEFKHVQVGYFTILLKKGSEKKTFSLEIFYYRKFNCSQKSKQAHKVTLTLFENNATSTHGAAGCCSVQ